MLGKVTSDLLKSETTSHFLSIKDISVLILLHHLHLPQLTVLLFIQLVPLGLHHCQVSLFSHFNLLCHLMLVHLTVEDTFVGVLHLIFV